MSQFLPDLRIIQFPFLESTHFCQGSILGIFFFFFLRINSCHPHVFSHKSSNAFLALFDLQENNIEPYTYVGFLAMFSKLVISNLEKLCLRDEDSVFSHLTCLKTKSAFVSSFVFFLQEPIITFLSCFLGFLIGSFAEFLIMIHTKLVFHSVLFILA